MEGKEKEKIIKYLEGKTDRNEREEVLEKLLHQEYGSRELLGKIWQHGSLNHQMASSTEKQLIIDKIHHRINIGDDQHNKKTTLRKISRGIRRIAAILFIPLMAYFLYDALLNQGSLTSGNEYVEVFSQQGVRSKLVLPDGTNVWLNNASSLRYPVTFGKTRDVELNGEGYFEVSHNRQSPFVVKTENLNVQVLGTKFNIASYSDDDKVEVALLEGSVALFSKNDTQEQFLSELTPGELASYYPIDRRFKINETDTRRHIAWRDGKLCFYETPMREVAREMERWYNCQIVIDNEKLANMHLTATFEGENLEQALKLMSLAAPTSYNITPAKKRNDGTFSKQKITIKNRSITK